MLTKKQRERVELLTLKRTERYLRDKQKERELLKDKKQSFDPFRDNLGFQLVRLWKNYPDAVPDDFVRYIKLVCDKYSINPIDLENEVDFGWENAKTYDDSEAFAEACGLAMNKPLPREMLRGRANKQFVIVSSIYYHLSYLVYPLPFHLHAEELASLLGFSEENQGDGVRKISKRMKERELIKCVDEDCIAHIKGKGYEWTGGRLAEEDEIDF